MIILPTMRTVVQQRASTSLFLLLFMKSHYSFAVDLLSLLANVTDVRQHS